VAFWDVNAAGTLGVTESEAAEAGPVPYALRAVTLNVYFVPELSPDTVTANASPATTTVTPPGLLVTK
jgi:hypothetical protein